MGGLSAILPLLLALATPARGAEGLKLLDAVRLLLEHDPNIAIVEARVRSSEGALLVASSQFDPVVSESVTGDRADDPTSAGRGSESLRVESSLGVAKQFRSGLSVEPTLDLTRTDDLTAGGAAVNLGTLTFNLRQPLLRGRGRAAVAAFELSAERSLAASRLDLEQGTAARILTVVEQFWTAVAARRDLEVLRLSEASSRTLLDTTRKLIDADQVPAAELVQLEANVAAKESATLSGERSYFAARQDLGREIGLDARAIGELPAPDEPFPAVDPAAVPAAPHADDAVAPLSPLADRLVDLALARRADLRAARERLSGDELLLAAADDALLPKLDLRLAPGYTGRVASDAGGDFFSPLYRNVPGASVTLGFDLSWPTANRRAYGELVESRAAREQSALAVALVATAIGADVPTALDAVASAARQRAKAEQAVHLFERAVDNEEKKLRAGSSTLLDVISQRDRLTAAQQGLVSSDLSLALALARLRFETGTLLAVGGEEGTATATTAASAASAGSAAVDHDRLTTLPAAAEERP